MANKTTLNQDASNNNKNNSGLSSESQALIKTVESILSNRFKGAKNKGTFDKQLEEYTQLIKDGVLDAQKLADIQSRKSAQQLAKEKHKQELNDQIIASKLRMEALKAEIEVQSQNDEKRKEAESAFQEEQRKLQAAQMAEIGNKLKEGFEKQLDQSIEHYSDVFSKYSASINARLQQGSILDDARFRSLVTQVKYTLGSSPFVKQEAMLDSLNELIQKGVNYNIEQRAFLQTVTDKVVTTFDAFDSNLLNLIRLQQSDSTAARMGMEATLTKSLNSMFKDTSYLTDTFDSVSGALFETIAQLGRDAGLEFEYVVQKWLGSLGSVGVGSDTLTKIATAINYLGTGNVEALQSDTAMQNLFVMASNKQGMDYAQLLTQGINAQSANNLLRGIVDYVQEIASTNNQVVRQQYGQLFGFSMADMVAALNLNTKELDTVQKAMVNYTTATKEAQTQMLHIPLRMQVSEMINNIFENTMASAASTIANNPALYMTWKAVNAVQGMIGDLDIPFINANGFGVDLNTGVLPLMKGGIVGIGMVGSLLSALTGLFTGGGLNLNAWGAEEYLKRGSGFGGVSSGYQATTSNTTAIVSTSGSDMASQSITAASEESEEKLASAKSEETATEKMLKAIMKAVTGSDDPESGASTVNVQLINSSTNPLYTINLTDSIF